MTLNERRVMMDAIGTALSRTKFFDLWYERIYRTSFALSVFSILAIFAVAFQFPVSKGELLPETIDELLFQFMVPGIGPFVVFKVTIFFKYRSYRWARNKLDEYDERVGKSNGC